MKKIFFGISMMLLSAVGFTAAAQTQENGQAQNQCKQEQCDKAKKCDNAKKDGKKCDKAKRVCKGDSTECKGIRKGDRPDKGMAFNGKHKGKKLEGKRFDRRDGQRGNREQLFSGIELSDAQKARLEALDQKMAEERKAMKNEAAEKSQEARAEARKAKDQARQAYNSAIKEILTAEQYTKYEANRDAMKVRVEGKKDIKRMKNDFRSAKEAKVIDTESSSK